MFLVSLCDKYTYHIKYAFFSYNGLGQEYLCHIDTFLVINIFFAKLGESQSRLRICAGLFESLLLIYYLSAEFCFSVIIWNESQQVSGLPVSDPLS